VAEKRRYFIEKGFMADTPPESHQGSQASLEEADRDRAQRSSHGGLGAVGYVSEADRHQSRAFLSSPGEVAVVDPPPGGLPHFQIAVAWDNVAVERAPGPISRFFRKKILHRGVDLDLGCLYKLKNGLRGGLQSFGEMHGSLESEPYIGLSHDERTGDKKGPDELIAVNGSHWDKIEEILIYVYIYDGARNWASVRPQVQVRVPGEQPMIVTLNTAKNRMPVCAVAGIESVRSGIRLTSYLEYFPGHAEMDRAFGYGLEWESGVKRR